MKIGIFDSGLGGLFVMRSIVKRLPQYDYMYCGDTERVPYGNRSHATIYSFTTQALTFLFENKCELVILACNSASAQALRQIQQDWMPRHFPKRKVLGVIIPTVETVLEKKVKNIGVLATVATVSSHSFRKEIQKRFAHAIIIEKPAPLLVPFVESGETVGLQKTIARYVAPFKKMDAVILGCTHYGILLRRIKKELPATVCVISENSAIPKKIQTYLQRHPEIETKLSKKKNREFFATKITPTLSLKAKKWFGASILLRKAEFAK